MEKGWQKHSTKTANKKQKTIYRKRHFEWTSIKQLCIQVMRCAHSGAIIGLIGATPCKIGETADQHYWFKFLPKLHFVTLNEQWNNGHTLPSTGACDLKNLWEPCSLKSKPTLHAGIPFIQWNKIIRRDAELEERPIRLVVRDMWLSCWPSNFWSLLFQRARVQVILWQNY